MPDEQSADRGLKINDRRLFTTDGALREGAVIPEDPPKKPVTPPPSPRKDQAANAKRPARPAAGPAPQPSREEGESPFTSFLISLATSALVSLGEIPHPATRELGVNLEAAQHTIETLMILQEKTQGNLTPDEERIFSHLLYDLRMKFVEIAQKQK